MMGQVTVKIEYNENQKSVTANAKLEETFDTDNTTTESYIKEHSSTIKQMADELMNEALTYSKVRTDQKQRS